ncbi:MAG TPA: DUF2798 domain-containing protein [Candidatus Limnocylindrales bacterium]|nr:DUF2798 domain-containing protein [Candidatus Limnocylindrales bacterium]
MKKFPKKYSGLLIGIIMPFIMIPIVSFVITYLNVGFTSDFFQKWMVALGGGLPVAVPVAIFVAPFVKGIVDKITE